MINYDEDINCCSCCRSCPPPIWLFVLRDPRATVFLLVRVCQIWSLTTVPSGSAQCETCQSVAHCGSQENINNLSPHTHTHKHRRRNVQKHLQSVNLYIAGGEETQIHTLDSFQHTSSAVNKKSIHSQCVPDQFSPRLNRAECVSKIQCQLLYVMKKQLLSDSHVFLSSSSSGGYRSHVASCWI